jgi:hypothetical protein
VSEELQPSPNGGIGRAEKVERAIKRARDVAAKESGLIDSETQLLSLTQRVIDRTAKAEETMRDITEYISANLDNQEGLPVSRIDSLAEAYKTLSGENYRILTAIRRGRDKAETDLRQEISGDENV